MNDDIRDELLAIRSLVDAALAKCNGPTSGVFIAKDERIYMTSEEFGERWNVSEATVRRYCKAGMPGERIGNRWRIPVEKADSWVKAGGSATTSEHAGSAAAKRGA